MSRRAWRRAVLVWVLAVAVGGGLTVWLQDAAKPPERPAWYRTGDSDPAPLLRQDKEAAESMCPATPGATPTPEETSRVIVVCVRHPR